MAKLQSHIVEFNKSYGCDQTNYEVFQDLANHWRAEKFGHKTTYDMGASLQEKDDIMHKALMVEVKRLSGISEIDFEVYGKEAFISHPLLGWATYAVVSAMVDAIIPEVLTDEFSVFTDIRTVGYGDNTRFDVKPRDLFVISKHGNARRRTEMHKQRMATVTIETELRAISVQASLYRIMCGNESLAEFAMKLTLSMTNAIWSDVYDALVAAFDELPATPENEALNHTGWDYNKFVELSQKVSAWNGGGKVVAVGTLSAVSKIMPELAGMRYDISSPFVKTGYIPNVAGVDVLVLPQLADWRNPFALKLLNDRIWLISPSEQKLIKLVLEGAIMTDTKGAWDSANLLTSTTMFKRWGTGICTNAIAAQIKLED